MFWDGSPKSRLDLSEIERRAKRLKECTVNEIDPNDHQLFSEVSCILGLSNKKHLEKESDLLRIFIRFQKVFKEVGLEIPYDIEGILNKCIEREKIEEIDKESDLIEIELTKEKKTLSDLYIARERVKELQKEKAHLEDKAKRIEALKKQSQISKEIIQLAQDLAIEITNERSGTTAEPTNEYHEDFHSLFIPYPNLSIEAVNYLYSQILTAPETKDSPLNVSKENKEYKEEYQSTYINTIPHKKNILDKKIEQKKISKEKAVSEYIKYVRDLNVFLNKITIEKKYKESLECQLIRVLLERKSIPIDMLVTRLAVSRGTLIEKIFLFVAQKIVYFDRVTDRLSLHSQLLR
ncbi:hypothetical protein NEOKW01_0465 [Nematocida sp. AWRm80]|nr:hypothetical protein NEOKW01_0465 [Nematocida sp. AWRm80]